MGNSPGSCVKVGWRQMASFVIKGLKCILTHQTCQWWYSLKQKLVICTSCMSQQMQCQCLNLKIEDVTETVLWKVLTCWTIIRHATFGCSLLQVWYLHSWNVKWNCCTIPAIIVPSQHLGGQFNPNFSLWFTLFIGILTTIWPVGVFKSIRWTYLVSF